MVDQSVDQGGGHRELEQSQEKCLRVGLLGSTVPYWRSHRERVDCETPVSTEREPALTHPAPLIFRALCSISRAIQAHRWRSRRLATGPKLYTRSKLRV